MQVGINQGHNWLAKTWKSHPIKFILQWFLKLGCMSWVFLPRRYSLKSHSLEQKATQVIQLINHWCDSCPVPLACGALSAICTQKIHLMMEIALGCRDCWFVDYYYKLVMFTIILCDRSENTSLSNWLHFCLSSSLCLQSELYYGSWIYRLSFQNIVSVFKLKHLPALICKYM